MLSRHGEGVRFEWTMHGDDEDSIRICDDDFTYDAHLKISGDFGEPGQRLAYAKEIVNLLNGHAAPRPAPAGAAPEHEANQPLGGEQRPRKQRLGAGVERKASPQTSEQDDKGNMAAPKEPKA